MDFQEKKDKENILTITGKITSITSPRGNAWAFGRIRIDQDSLDNLLKNSDPDDFKKFPNCRDISFAGFLDAAYIKAGSRAHLRGEFIVNPKYGLQFQVAEADLDRGIASGGLAAWIAVQPGLTGIGPVKAGRLVSEFGNRLADEISTPEQRRKLAHYFRVPEETLARLHALLTDDTAGLAIRTWLTGLGITQGQAKKLIDKYGLDTRRILESDPYKMIDDIDGFGFFRADQIAKKTGVPEDSPGRLCAGIIYVLQQDCEQNGNTWMDAGQLVDAANKMLAMNTLNAKERIRAVIEDLKNERKITKSENRISLAWLYDMEMWVINYVDTYTEQPNLHFMNRDLNSICNWVETLGLNEDQNNAFFSALRNRVAVITGGAGTGKTFLIRAIATAYQDAGLHVVLCAPTGKAARRITESTGFPAATIHRTLGYRGYEGGPEGEWEYCLRNHLPCDCVIVDEMSMVDSVLAYRLFQAIDLRRTSVVMVGDANQLPPVGPGQPFKDMIKISEGKN